MPREDRRIIFTYDEAYKAIFSICTQKEIKKPPAGQINNIEKKQDDEHMIIVHLENPQEKWDANRQIEYSRDFMAAALMLMCRSCNIPLPKTGKKSVVLGSKDIILRVEI